MSLLNPAQSYTFSKYFELRFESSELAEEFGYTLRRQEIEFLPFEGELSFLADLKHRSKDSGFFKRINGAITLASSNEFIQCPALPIESTAIASDARGSD